LVDCDASGAVVGFGRCDDAWITTAALSQVVDRLRFLVAFRPGSVSPTLAAQQAMTFQRHTGGRLLLNIVTGGEDQEQRRYGRPPIR
jgi:alkanesulfonate monooxygenase